MLLSFTDLSDVNVIVSTFGNALFHGIRHTGLKAYNFTGSEAVSVSYSFLIPLFIYYLC